MRLNVVLDPHASTLYSLAGEEYAARNPDAGPPQPSAVFRYLLRTWGASRGKGVPAPVEAPAAPAAPVAPVEEQPVAAAPPAAPIAPVEEQPVAAAPPAAPIAVAPVEEPVVASAAPVKRKSSRGPKASATPKPSKASGKRSKAAAPARDPRQTVIPGAEASASKSADASTGGAFADVGDVAAIAEYLRSPGALAPEALANAAGHPGARTKLFDIKRAVKAGGKLPGLRASTAEAILVFIASLPGDVARVSQETPGQ